jgi:hypothetical protein
MGSWAPVKWKSSAVDVPPLAEYLSQLVSTRREGQEIAKELQVDARDIKLELDATATAA